MINTIKQFISFNLLALFSWFTAISFGLVLKEPAIYKAGSALGLFIALYLLFTFGSLVIIGFIFLVESVIPFRIKNKFILENKFYNLFFVTGISFVLIFLFLCIVAIAIKLFSQIHFGG